MRRARRYNRSRTMCECRILSLRLRVAFAVDCHVLSPCSLVLNIGAIYVVFYSKPHPTPHVLIHASRRSLTWRSKCDALLEIIHNIRCKSFCVLSSGAVCIFSTTHRSWARLEYPKSATSTTAIEYTQEVLRVRCNSLFFRARCFFVCTKRWSLRSVVVI